MKNKINDSAHVLNLLRVLTLSGTMMSSIIFCIIAILQKCPVVAGGQFAIFLLMIALVYHIVGLWNLWIIRMKRLSKNTKILMSISRIVTAIFTVCCVYLAKHQVLLFNGVNLPDSVKTALLFGVISGVSSYLLIVIISVEIKGCDVPPYDEYYGN